MMWKTRSTKRDSVRLWRGNFWAVTSTKQFYFFTNWYVLLCANPLANTRWWRGLIPWDGMIHWSSEVGNPLQYSCVADPMDGSLVGDSPGDHKELIPSEHTCMPLCAYGLTISPALG